MGDPNKLLLQLDGKPMIYSVCKTVMEAKINQLILVTGHDRFAIEDAVPKGIDNIMFNKDWKRGNDEFNFRWIIRIRY